MSIATKVLVVDLYAVQRAVPTRTKKPQPETKETKQTKNTQPQPNQNKQKTQRSGIATSNGNNMHDDILCVIMRMATEQEAKQRKHGITQRARLEGDRSNKAQCGNQGSPQPGSRDHREQPFRHNIHLALRSKHRQRRVATRVVKTNKGETGGET